MIMNSYYKPRTEIPRGIPIPVLILIGVVGFTVVLTIAGLIQGNAWLNGETVYRVLPEIHMYYITRASIGLLVFSSAILGLYNIIRTLYFNPGEKLS